MSLESFVAENIQRFTRITDSDSAKNIQEHEEAVGCLASFESLLEAVGGDGRWFQVGELCHTAAFCVEHPYDVSSDGFAHDGLDHLLCHFDAADQCCDEEMAEVGTVGFGGLTVAEVS